MQALPCAAQDAAAPRPQWAGQGAYRVLVEAPALALGDRVSDQAPAIVQVDFRKVLADMAVDALCDPATLQVIRYDSATGKPVEHGGFVFAKSPFDVPFRFDQVDPRPHWWLHNLLGDGQSGTLAWMHMQDRGRPSRYAVYFDTVPAGQTPGTAPRGWVGDGDSLFRESGPLPSLLHTRPCAFDWDEDGRLDLLVGYIRGYVFLYRNLGTPGEPRFQGPYFVEADGKPLKVPWYSVPRIADWNGDGTPDLLVGHDPKGAVRYFENIGVPGEPKLVDRGPITAGGKVIYCPHEPVPEAPGIFKKDYTGVPAIVDWNADGRLDLLVGGYVTGRIFYYENVGTKEDGTPELASRGPLMADGEMLDVSWQAAPAVADIDGDGLLELITGSMFMSATGGEQAPPDRPGLFMYKNVGTKEQPKLHRVPFPLQGRWGETFLLNPVFTDWDGDGLLDVLIGANSQTVVYRNVGTKAEPMFLRQKPLRIDWVTHMVHPGWMGDWDGDGGLDYLQAHGGSTVALHSAMRVGNPPLFKEVAMLRTAQGSNMCHKPEHGDAWAVAVAYDWDGDGDLDTVVGDVAGYVWLYSNTGSRAEPSFAEGVRLQLADGVPLVAGIDPDTPVTDFTVLQGNRAVPACGDYNGDGLTDLVCGDAVGGVTYFENVGTSRAPRFAPGRPLAKLGGRVHVASADLNGDGLADIIAAASGASAGQQVMLVCNVLVDGKPTFEFPGKCLPLSWIPYPQPSVVDINGDGDTDILLASSYSALYFVEGSFIEHGAAQARILAAERR